MVNKGSISLLLIIGFLIECYCGFMLFNSHHATQEDLIKFNLYHMISTMIVFTIVLSVYYQSTKNFSEFRITFSKRRSFWVFFLSLWAFIPILGPVISMCLYFNIKKFETADPKALSALIESTEVEDSFFRELSLNMLAERFETKGETTATSLKNSSPMVMIMKSGDTESKKKAIRVLRTNPDKDSIKLIKMAQRDPNYDIQYLATMTILALEKEWMEETNKLLELIQSEPRNRNLHLSLSNAFLDAVNSGLVSGKLSQIYLGHALEHINVCIEIDGSQAETWVEKGKILLMLFRAAEARDAFANAIKLKPEMNGVHFWKAEAHYYLREFDQSKLECSIMMQTGLYPSKIKENVEFWGANEKYKS